MVANPLVTHAELQQRPGFENVTEDDVSGLLEDASAEVRLVAEPELDDVESPDTPPMVRAVVVNMVRRGLTNPRGVAQETLGDYSYSAGGSGIATLYMTRREKRLVRRAVGKLGVGTAQLEGDLPLPREIDIDDLGL